MSDPSPDNFPRIARQAGITITNVYRNTFHPGYPHRISARTRGRMSWLSLAEGHTNAFFGNRIRQ
jgi:hypothetical protein